MIKEVGQVGVAMNETFLVHVDEEMHKGKHQTLVSVRLFTQYAHVGVATVGGDEIALEEKSVGIDLDAGYRLWGADVQFDQSHAEDVGASGFARTYEGVVEALEEKRCLEAFHHEFLAFYCEYSYLVATVVDQFARVIEDFWNAFDKRTQVLVARVDFYLHLQY